jgi:hypothetical protein
MPQMPLIQREEVGLHDGESSGKRPARVAPAHARASPCLPSTVAPSAAYPKPLGARRRPADSPTRSPTNGADGLHHVPLRRRLTKPSSRGAELPHSRHREVTRNDPAALPHSHESTSDRDRPGPLTPRAPATRPPDAFTVDSRDG